MVIKTFRVSFLAKIFQFLGFSHCYMYAIKSHVKALGFYKFIRGFGCAYIGGRGAAYKRNIKKMSER